MNSVAQVVTLVLAVAGTVISAVALVVNRSNARDAKTAAETATQAKAQQDKQSLAHTELVDALDAQGKLIDRYRQQIDDTRREMGSLLKQIDDVRRERTEERKEWEQDRSRLEVRIRTAETRIAELGG